MNKNVIINNKTFDVKEGQYKSMCDNFKKRIIKLLYLREDIIEKRTSIQDVNLYIESLSIDLYGASIIFDNSKFLNCICELEGIKYNISNEIIRKKILDLANYIASI